MNFFQISPVDNKAYHTYYHRERLLTQLNQHSGASLIGVFADSGFGKTSLIYSYILKQQMNTIWYNLDGADAFDRLFLQKFRNHLMHILGQTEISSTASSIAASYEEGMLEILEKLEMLTQPTAIVFDNCHFAAKDAEFQHLIVRLLSTYNRMVTLIIIGRARPDLAFASLRAKNKYFEVGVQDLAFSRGETADFFCDFHHMPLGTHEIDLIWEKTDGWVASYQLILNYLQQYKKSDKGKLGLDFLSEIPDIFDYLSQEVFAAVPYEMQEFMLRTSAVSELTPTVVDSLLGIADSEQMIQSLLAHHSFVYHTENGSIKYHPLLRRFLYEKWFTQRQEDMRQAHLRLSAIYQDHRHYITAFAHAVASDDYARGTELMRLIEKRYTPNQILSVVDGHLEEVSPLLLFSNTSLFLSRCTPEKLLIEFIMPLQEAILNEQSLLKLANLQHRLATIYYHCGEISKARELLDVSCKNAGLLHDYPLLAFNYQLLADCELAEGKHNEGIQYAKQALFVAEKFSIIVMQIHTLEVFTRLCLAIGQLEQADSYIAQALEIAKTQSHELYWLYAAKSQVLMEQEDYQQSIEFAERALEIVRSGNCEYDISYGHLVLARAHLKNNQTVEAEANLDSAYVYSRYCGLLRYEVLQLQRLISEQKGDWETIRQKDAELSITCRNYGYGWFLKNREQISTTARNDGKLFIQTLGRFMIERHNEIISLKRSSSVNLLLFLITNRNKSISKDLIMEGIFPDSRPSSANHFNVALSTLRKALESELSSGHKSQFIVRTGDRYQLNMENIDLDVERFDKIYTETKSVEKPSQISLLQLEQMYQGDFLEEYLYEPFIEVERERIRLQYIDILHQIARSYKQFGEYYKSVEYYEKILQKDPYLEEIYMEFLVLLLTIRAGATAKRAAQRMIKYIEGELGVPCSDELIRLFAEYHYILNL